jgi:hypothetical protein
MCVGGLGVARHGWCTRKWPEMGKGVVPVGGGTDGTSWRSSGAGSTTASTGAATRMTQSFYLVNNCDSHSKK